MTQISIPATAVFFWGLYVTFFGFSRSQPDFGHFRKSWESWEVFVLRSSISAIFASLGNLCFKDFDFDHFGHFRESWESWEVFVLRSHFPWFFGSSKGAPLQNRQQHPIFHFLKFSTGFRGLLRFCSPKPISTWKWLYVRRTEPIISLI